MTLDLDEWMSLPDLLAMPLNERIRYVRDKLGLTQGEFADAVGASSGRQTVIRWEKEGEKGAEPSLFARSIAGLTPYPVDAFRRAEARGVSLATLDIRLRAIEARLEKLATAEDVVAALEPFRAAEAPN